jgi:RraA family protein
MSIGWRSLASAPQVDAPLVERARALSVSLLSDNAARAIGAIGVVAQHGDAPLAGTAVTVRTRSGDNLAIYRAFASCRPGDVLVVDGGGALDQALVGEIMTTYAEHLGVAGVVIDGAVRDVAAIRRRGYPVFARGVTHRGPYKDGPGEINVPVSIGGMVIHPGDLVVGDPDGLIALGPDEAPVVVEAAEAKDRKEAATLADIASYDLSWIEDQITRRR